MKVVVGQTRRWIDAERDSRSGPFVVVCVDGTQCWLRYDKGRHTTRESVRCSAVAKGSS